MVNYFIYQVSFDMRQNAIIIIELVCFDFVASSSQRFAIIIIRCFDVNRNIGLTNRIANETKLVVCVRCKYGKCLLNK